MKKKRSILTGRIIALITAVMLTGCAENIDTRETSTAAPQTTQTVTAAAETSAASAAPPPRKETAAVTIAATAAAAPTPPEKPDPTAEVYAAAKPLEGLKLVPASKQGVYKLVGLPEKEPELEYHHGTVVAFECVKTELKIKTDSEADSESETESESQADSESKTDNDSHVDSVSKTESESQTDSESKTESESQADSESESDGEKEDGGLMLETFNIRIYDMQKSLILGETDSITTGYYPYNWETCGSFDDGYYSCMGNKFRIMDIGMNVRSEFELPLSSCTRVWVTDSGRFILCNSRRGPSSLFDAETQTEISLSRNVKAAGVISKSGDTFEIITAKGERFTITGGGEVTSLGILEIPAYYRESLAELSGRVIDLVPSGLCVREPAEGTALLADKLPEKISYIIAATKRYITYTGENGKSRVIDLEAGKVSEEIGKGKYAMRGDSLDDDFIFYNGSRYCLAVPSELKYEQTIGTTGLDLKTEEYLLYFQPPQPDSDRSEQLLDELLNTYNVRVMFAPIDEDVSYCGYYCKAYNGSQAEILEGLKDFLALSPPAILTEATKFGAETWILICSTIVDDPELSSFGAAGFTAEIGLHPFVALETPLDEKQAKAADHLTESELYEQFKTTVTNNFSHEFIHILDRNTTAFQLDEWDSLSPDDAYFNSYNSVSGDERYIHPSGEFDDNVYFTDIYGRVNELEDKARIGENLYYARLEEKKAARAKFACSRSLYDKAVKLCGILRENYDCLDEIPKGEWYLEKPLLGSYKEMKKAYIKEKNGE